MPAFLIAIHWRGLRAGPAAAGLLVGSAIAFTGVLLEMPRVGGVHLGLIGLGVNAGIGVVGSALVQRAQGR